MKTLGTKQYQQKTFKYLDVPEEWKKTVGSLLRHFICIIYGKSGNGKTEFCVRFAKMLTEFGLVAWVSYEQGHGGDLQMAINRNKMEEVSGKIIWADPNEKRKAGMSYLDELCEWLDKRNSPDFIFIDSLKYTKWTFDDYIYLKLRYGHKKAFIFIDHAKSPKEPARQTGIDIEFDGHLGLSVDRYICYVNKSRLGGFEPYVIYEARARELNPAFFLKKGKNKPQEGDQLVLPESDSSENMHIPPLESAGVHAENASKTNTKKAHKTLVEV